MQRRSIELAVEDQDMVDVVAATALRTRVFEQLQKQRSVTLNLTRAESMSAHYAATVFTSLARHLGRERLLAGLRVIGAQDFMYRMIAEAICRCAPGKTRAVRRIARTDADID